MSPHLDLSTLLNTAFPPASAPVASPEAAVPVHVIPQGGEPRWVVIGDSRRAAPVLHNWRPFKISTRARWAAVVSASSLGMLSRLPGVITTRLAIDLSYWRTSLPGFQDDWVPVLYVGNPSHTRKVTLFFVGRHEPRFKAAAKVPLQPLSAHAILNEAEILEQLAGSEFVPVALFKDLGRGIAAQSWLPGDPVSRKLVPAHMELLARFAIPGETVKVSAMHAFTSCELDQLDGPFDRDVFSRALEFLEYDAPLPAFIEHRDFAPWNLKRLPDGRTGAIDWEWAVLRGLPCQDIFRFFYIQDALFYGPGDAWHRLNQDPLVRRYLQAFSIPKAAMPALAMYYQLRVLCMDWQSGNSFLSQYALRQIDSLLKLNPTTTFRE
jgi:Phosphotransferase enzyme family